MEVVELVEFMLCIIDMYNYGIYIYQFLVRGPKAFQLLTQKVTVGHRMSSVYGITTIVLEDRVFAREAPGGNCCGVTYGTLAQAKGLFV